MEFKTYYVNEKTGELYMTLTAAYDAFVNDAACVINAQYFIDGELESEMPMYRRQNR